MCAAFGSALGKEKIKMKKEDVKIRRNSSHLYDKPVFSHKCLQIVNKL